MHLLIHTQTSEGQAPAPPERYPATPRGLTELARALPSHREAAKKKYTSPDVYVTSEAGDRIPQEDLDYVLYGDKPQKERSMSRDRRPDERRLQPKQLERAQEVLANERRS